MSEPHDDSAVGRLMQSIIECVDEFYSENLGEEVTRGMRESASRGFYLSSRPLYGYRKVRVNDGGKERTKLEIDEFQSRVVAAIFDEVMRGEGLTAIVKGLNAKGIAGPRGKGWRKTSLRKMIGNEVYAGVIAWGHNSKRNLPVVRVDNACPAIVSREVFQQAEKPLGERSFDRVPPRRVSIQYLLSGLARCGYCDKALTGLQAKSGEFSYYICGTLTKKGSGSCPSRYQNTRKLEGLVVDKIKERILTRENLTELAIQVAQAMNASSEDYRAELKSIEDEIADVVRRVERLYEVIETKRILPGDLGPRIHELNERREKLRARKEELDVLVAAQSAEVPSAQEVNECVSDLREVLERGSLAEKKAFIWSFVKEIRITGDDVKLTYTMPSLPASSQQGAEPVLAIEHYGGPSLTKGKTPTASRPPFGVSGNMGRV